MGQKSNEILQSSLETIERKDMKDKCRQKLQENQWDIDPMSLRILEETQRGKGFKEKIKIVVLRQLSSEWTNDNHKSL